MEHTARDPQALGSVSLCEEENIVIFLGASMMQRDKPVDTGLKVKFLNLTTLDGAGIPSFMQSATFFIDSMMR